MAVKTQAQLLADINNKLIDNNTGEITEPILREILSDMVDSTANGIDSFDIDSGNLVGRDTAGNVVATISVVSIMDSVGIDFLQDYIAEVGY